MGFAEIRTARDAEGVPDVQSMKNGDLLASFLSAIAGIRFTLRTQRNARIHAAAAALAVGLGLFLGLAPMDLAVLLLAIGAVLVAEMVNTAIEAAVDLAAPFVHPLAGTAKDIAAGAVLLTALAAVAVGLLILGPHILARL